MIDSPSPLAINLPLQSSFPPAMEWLVEPTSLVGVSAVPVLDAVLNCCKWTKQVQKTKRGKKYQVLSLAVRKLTRTLKISGSIHCSG